MRHLHIYIYLQKVVYCVCGCVSVFQMIEMECFKEINVFEMDGALCSDLDVNKPNPAPKRGFFYRLFHREASASVPPAAVRGGGAWGIFWLFPNRPSYIHLLILLPIHLCLSFKNSNGKTISAWPNAGIVHLWNVNRQIYSLKSTCNLFCSRNVTYYN